MKLKLLLTFTIATVIGFVFLIKASTPLSDITAKRGEEFTPPRPALSSSIPARSIASTSSDLSRELDGIRAIEACLQHHCAYDDSDPRAYELSVYKDLGRKLMQMQERFHLGQEDSADIAKITRYYLSFEDGYVKEAALSLMASQAPSDHNFAALQKFVFTFHDPLIVAQGMGELRKYLGAHDREIDYMLFSVLKTGSLMAREAVAKDIYPFIREDNYRQIVAVRSNYKKGSRVYRLLTQALIQFDNR